MDFMSDSLLSGRKFRTLNLMDDYNREALAIEVDTSLPAERVIRVLDQITDWRGKPKSIRVDNGPEFISTALGLWCEEKEIHLQFIQPGKPTQNAYIESFNGLYRRHILDAHLFETLEDVRTITEEWINHYNTEKPHQSLHNMTPKEYLLKYGQLEKASTSEELPTFQQISNSNNENSRKNSFL